ncbi:hypothetical protein [Bradyrhizobium sp. SZCCHNR1039]|uniref:hypothetical protein n=1 Tax=Bradyrhizobium sp. SZCCHNR1039 TaxID=3057350 RepID=UPI00291624B0|nr:hypothetical protein [Bradyrhizobium sp. SZCCHNR1039]
MNLTLPDQFWSSPAFPMWLTLAAAAFFGLVVLVTLLRAEKSVANGALTVITLLAVGIAVASTMRSLDEGGHSEASENAAMPAGTMLPALACVDDLAGDLVLSNCEKNLFGAADATAAAVSYAGAMISRLTATGDVTAANKIMTPELLALRRAIERDRYGLMAYVLLTRDRCTPSDCYAFRSVTDRQQLVSNMEGRTYEGLVTRYASQWNVPQAAPGAQSQAATGSFAGLAPSMPTGKPTNAEFPSASSTPPVSIMVPEPTASTSRSAATGGAASAAPAPRAPSPAVAASHAQAPAKKPAAPKPKPPASTPQAAPEAAEPAPSNE